MTSKGSYYNVSYSAILQIDKSHFETLFPATEEAFCNSALQWLVIQGF